MYLPKVFLVRSAALISLCLLHAKCRQPEPLEATVKWTHTDQTFSVIISQQRCSRRLWKRMLMVLIDRKEKWNKISRCWLKPSLSVQEPQWRFSPLRQLEPSKLYLSHWSLINGLRRLRVQTTLCKMGFKNVAPLKSIRGVPGTDIIPVRSSYINSSFISKMGL